MRSSPYIHIAAVLIITVFIVGIAMSYHSRSDSVEQVGLELPDEYGENIGAVVSAHGLATNAGYEVLQAGGTAADAAVAVAAALSVVEPWFSSALGGGTWALYYDAANGEVTSLDGVGPTGSKVTAADYRRRVSQAGIHQSNTPGAWDGWMLWLEKYGRLDLGEVLAPAIRIAKEGYPVSSEMADWLGREAGNIRNRPDTARIYMKNGRVLRGGEIVQQNDMAATFEALAGAYDETKGQNDTAAARRAGIQAARDYYYRGPLAQAIVEFSDKNNGYLTIEDFNEFEAQIVKPLSIDYRNGVEVFQNPPNSQGITMLMALNILKKYDLGSLSADGADALHLQAEAIKLAFADRFYHVGDPARVNVPVQQLLSEQHAENQKNRIDMSRAMRWPLPDYLSAELAIDEDLANTTTFHIVDSHGNGAAVTTSLGAQFLVVGNTGIHMNNRMRFLALDDGNPNQVSPGYKVRHTSNPYMAFRNGNLYILGGNTGADTQVQAQVQQFVNIVDFGKSAKEAIAAPRFVSTAFPSTTYPYEYSNLLRVEGRMPGTIISALRAKGHNVQMGGAGYGTANVIILSEDGQTADIGAESRSNVAAGRTIKF